MVCFRFVFCIARICCFCSCPWGQYLFSCRRCVDIRCDALLLSTDFPFFLIWVLKISNSVRLHACAHETKHTYKYCNTHQILRYAKYIELIQYCSWLSLFGKSSVSVTTLSLRASVFPSQILAIPIGIKIFEGEYS